MQKGYLKLPYLLLVVLFSVQSIAAAIVTIESEEQYNSLANDKKPVVVKYSAVWCGACKAVKGAFDAVANDPAFSDVVFAEVDIDNKKLEKLVTAHNVTGVPTFFYVHEGKTKHQDIGVKDPATFKEYLEATVREHLKGGKGTEAGAAPGQEAPAPAQPAEHHEGFAGTLVDKIKAFFMWIFMSIRSVLMSIVNWVKGLFGK